MEPLLPGEDERLDRMLDPRVLDPAGEVVDYAGMSDEDIRQTVKVLQAIRNWRESEQRMSLRSRNQMKLNETDMKALRYLVAAKNDGRVVTPGLLAEHLRISSASTTKLLDRLAAAGHVERAPHPNDRRALVVTITQDTHRQVRDTVGHMHARRFQVAAALSSAERETVAQFLNALAATGDDPVL
jgi:DNA-binding MarR family transcriptional regulator